MISLFWNANTIIALPLIRLNNCFILAISVGEEGSTLLIWKESQLAPSSIWSKKVIVDFSIQSSSLKKTRTKKQERENEHLFNFFSNVYNLYIQRRWLEAFGWFEVFLKKRFKFDGYLTCLWKKPNGTVDFWWAFALHSIHRRKWKGNKLLLA